MPLEEHPSGSVGVPQWRLGAGAAVLSPAPLRREWETTERGASGDAVLMFNSAQRGWRGLDRTGRERPSDGGLMPTD